MIFFLLIGFILGAAVIIFALQNTEVASLMFLGWQFESSLALVILLAIASGVIISALVSLPSAIANGIRMMALRKENVNLRKELEETQRIAYQGTVVIEEPTSIYQ
ncbi:MAG: hypothetical protein AB199_01595 [Parcubacteria bacterium C7867-004]|nr:MAG: hypothetical protein AB199_01595 [Parcubacteria bacterium C7867-004]